MTTPVAFIVDDDPSVRKALVRILSAHGIATVACASGDELLEQVDVAVPGCVVLDLAMPGCDGLELQRKLIERGVRLPVTFLSGAGDVRSSVSAMKDGALDFLTKPVDADVLLATVKLAIERDLAERDAQRDRRAIEKRVSTLTPREREVLPHVLSGRLSKQIAGDLNIVEKTVKVHRSRIMHKLEAKSVAELVRLTERVGIRPARR